MECCRAVDPCIIRSPAAFEPTEASSVVATGRLAVALSLPRCTAVVALRLCTRDCLI